MAQQAAAMSTNPENDHTEAHGKFWALFVGCIGVVYGDIGTSPLYAFKEAVTHAKEHGAANEAVILGILSLIVWTLILIVTLKYVLILLKLDNKGEGGTFALMALGQQVAKRSAPLLTILGVAGVALFYGDAIITPAVSVLSAVEGLKTIAPQLERFVLPIALTILVFLFLMQSRGTENVAKYFGPITLVWFLALGVGGLLHLFDSPRVFLAFNPYYGLKFALTHGMVGFVVMGLVFLAVTGAEALYADLGHFGRRPIQLAWITLILPCLLLNYFGQASMLLADPSVIDNPFLKLYPNWARLPMVLLSMAATVIASQAVITGAFSITRQAISLGLLPRLEIRHTSETMAGQIYLPRVNWLLLLGVIIVTVTFKTSSNLAAAYGISVTATMVIDSIMAFFVVWRFLKWPLWQALIVMVPLAFIEQIFFAANFLKVLDGGWLPLLIAGLIIFTMYTWSLGAKTLSKKTNQQSQPLDWLVRKIENTAPGKPPHKVNGTAIFLTADPDVVPTSLMHNLKHNRVVHERNIIMSIRSEETPRVPRHERLVVEKVSDHFIKVVARYGFMETPSIPKILENCKRKDLNIDVGNASFFLSRRLLKATDKSTMPWLQEVYFIWLASTAANATDYYRIPHDRVVEVGTQVQI
jgi:KUP system potassium uptake protein